MFRFFFFFLTLASWEEQPSSTTTISTTQPTSPTTTFITRPQTSTTTTESTTTIKTPTTISTTTVTESTGGFESPNEQQTTHKPPTNRPWWSEYHTQKPEQHQPCKPGTYQPANDNCQTYYECKNGRYRRYSCRKGLSWNRNANKCDLSRNSNCNGPSEFFVWHPIIMRPITSMS